MKSEKNNKGFIGKKSKQFISLALVLVFTGVVAFNGYAYEPKDYTSSDINEDAMLTQELENEKELVEPERKTQKNKRFARKIKNAYARICEIKPDQDFINEAKDLGLAPGHYLMIKTLQVLDPEITVEEYKDAKGFEIIQKINELTKDSSVIENLDEDTKAIIKRAQEFAERIRNQERNFDEENPINRRFARRINEAYARICEIKPDQDFINEAKDLGLAPGHYLMIKALQVLDPEITIEEYKDAKGFEIIQKINELAKDSSVIENLDEDTKAIIKRAQEFAERIRNQERNFDEETPRNRRGDEQNPKNGLRERKDNNGVNRNSDKPSTVCKRVGNKGG